MDVRTRKVDRSNVQNPNKIVRISDVFEIRTKLLPDNNRTSENQTSSDFGIPLYILHTLKLLSGLKKLSLSLCESRFRLVFQSEQIFTISPLYTTGIQKYIRTVAVSDKAETNLI